MLMASLLASFRESRMHVRYPRMPDTLSFLLQKGVKCKENMTDYDVMGTVLEHI
jgi:hypothetical protein